MSSSPASLGPCHIQPHTIRQGWAEIEDKQAGGLGTNEEGRKVAGTWEKTKHRQGGPYLKTGSTQWGPAREKNPKRAHSTIAPPVCVSLRDVGTWQDTFLRRRRRPARSEASGTKDSLSFSARSSYPTSHLPGCACCYSCPAKVHNAAFRNIFSPAAVGKPPGTTKKAICGEDGRPRIAESRPWHVGAPKGEDEQRLFTRRRWPERYPRFKCHEPPAFAAGLYLPGAVLRLWNDDLSAF